MNGIAEYPRQRFVRLHRIVPTSFHLSVMRALILWLMCVPFTAFAAFAQGDLDAERASLKGIGSFGADVTIEGPRHLTESDVLRAEVILHRIVNRVRDGGLEVERSGPDARDQPANLHVHINMMEVDRGLVPFSISADFYQDVRLAGSGREMAAISWHERVLGLVSRDLLTAVSESVDALVDQFIDDYRAANKE